MANMKLYRIYCGPTIVADFACLLRRKGYDVTVEGTEAVYLRSRVGDFELWRSLKPEYSALPSDITVMHVEAQ